MMRAEPRVVALPAKTVRPIIEAASATLPPAALLHRLADDVAKVDGIIDSKAKDDGGGDAFARA
eukprot:CAMPEP_0181242100 /NCGR_PEP_ID=MMETSP1096-20121128/41494_1 /TAXON_ID=156174 ORGANISM="Chrysochromulina ericina, Strain CCMP281" /NCGR_SAMPLE_ID=MMETSP1096 /ASSEMBLY_ACC=CAM_ASM_000453 /LENGTH=63 /DNA_ID=CAMNT_0023338255 /DNA_START=703 /DNA_END=890 /DNA_ORIENTATION=-